MGQDERTQGLESREDRLFTPEEVAAKVGGLSVKSLTDLIRELKIETTTIGQKGPSPRGGRPRRIWGMTTSQINSLIDAREARRSPRRSRGEPSPTPGN